MNTTFMIRPLAALFAAALLTTGCTNNKEKENASTAENKSGTEAAPTTASATEAPAEKAQVGFSVNDTTAITKKGAANDSDPQLGMYTEASGQLSFDLMGDVPRRPHRGWLHISIKNFKFEPAAYTLSADTYASYTRYETANAGGSGDFVSDTKPENKGTELFVNFTKIEKDPSQRRTYLASGTFSAKLYNKIYGIERDSKTEVNISSGRFENVPITGGPEK